ncbi:hypothetical protein INR49_022885 [Caranx melampygus]|nr:hypothetical protein INR49_022885 [Caranx melampygus]
MRWTPHPGLTVMKIQLPTGVEAYLEDLRKVPSDIFVCVGFRTRTNSVSGASESLFRVYELHDRGSMCSKMFTSEEHTLQRLCVGRSVSADSGVRRVPREHGLTTRWNSGRRESVVLTSSTGEEFDAVSGGTELQLVKKATCGTVDIHLGKQYLGWEPTAPWYRLALDSEALVEVWPSDCTANCTLSQHPGDLC